MSLRLIGGSDKGVSVAFCLDYLQNSLMHLENMIAKTKQLVWA